MNTIYGMGQAERRLESVMERIRAAGIQVYNLAVEDMVFPAPIDAVDAAGQYLDEGSGYYTRPDGHPDLRDALRRRLAASGHIGADDEIAIGPGSRALMYLALIVSGQRGKEALIPAPFPPEYPAIITLSGMVPRIVILESPFKPTSADLERAISTDTRIICIQSPAQPSGMIVSSDILHGILDRTPDDVLIMWDGLFSGLEYGNNANSMPLVEGPGRRRILTFGSFSMTFSMSGWRIGYVFGPKHTISNIVSAQAALALQPSAFLQRAAASVLEHPEQTRESLISELTTRRDYVVHRLLRVKGISFWPPEAGFYLFISVDQLLSDAYPDALSWCMGLLEREHVAVVPGEQFGMPGYVRINFAVDQDVLSQAIAAIIRFAEHCVALKDIPHPQTAGGYLQPPSMR